MSRASLLLLTLALFGFKKGPQVQNVTAHEAWMIWESEGPAALKVSGPEFSAEHAPKIAAGEMARVTLKGLKPGRRYTYTLKDAKGEASGRFNTPPPAGYPFTFVIYGDNRDDHRAHAAVVKAMVAVEPDLAVNTGDLVGRGGRVAEWGTFFRISKPFLEIAPLYPVVGNHDVHGQGGEAYFKSFFALPTEGTYYAFTWGNVRFLAIDTEVQITNGHGMDEAQLKWAEAEVRRAEVDPLIDHIVAFGHRGPFSGNPRRHGNLGLQPQLRKLHGLGLDLIASGHDHFYERGVSDYGLPYMVVGGGGAPLYATKGPGDRGDHVAHVSRTIYSLTRVRVAGSVMSYCAIDVSNQPFDCGSITAAKEAPAPSKPTPVTGAEAPAATATPPSPSPPAPTPAAPTPAPR